MCTQTRKNGPGTRTEANPRILQDELRITSDSVPSGSVTSGGMRIAPPPPFPPSRFVMITQSNGEPTEVVVKGEKYVKYKYWLQTSES